MELKIIKEIAEKYKKIFEPYCERIEIAGSIRREKLNPNDIEIVAIPKKQNGRNRTELDVFLENENFDFEKNGRKYKQINLKEKIKLDLFLCQKENWGNIFLMRTGNWEFNKNLFGFEIKKRGYFSIDGFILDGLNCRQINCYEETDVFKLLGMDYIEPKDREFFYPKTLSKKHT